MVYLEQRSPAHSITSKTIRAMCIQVGPHSWMELLCENFPLVCFLLEGLYQKPIWFYYLSDQDISVSQTKGAHCFRYPKKIKIKLNLKEFFLFSFASAGWGISVSDMHLGLCFIKGSGRVGRHLVCRGKELKSFIGNPLCMCQLLLKFI